MRKSWYHQAFRAFFSPRRLFASRSKLSPEDTLVTRVQRDQHATYQSFYNNQYNVKDNASVIFRIIDDIKSRSLPNSLLQLPKFSKMRLFLEKIRDSGEQMLRQTGELDKISPQQLNSFVISYIEAMYELLKAHDPEISGTYYTQFAKDFMQEIYKSGTNTRLFFTFKDLEYDLMYFLDVRPTCFYPVNLICLPPFSQTAATYDSSSPLIPTKLVKKQVEGKFIDVREISFHDLGHSHVQKRQDVWLFTTLHRAPVQLVKEWIRNKYWFMNYLHQLPHVPFKKAVTLYLFDIVHDRGYQFYLPILKQQFGARKNLLNLKTKIKRGDFNDYPDKDTVDYIDSAQEWLLEITSEFLRRDNLDKANEYGVKNLVVHKFPEVGAFNGLPLRVCFKKGGVVTVAFQPTEQTAESNVESPSEHETSLYEIELLSLPVDKPILTHPELERLNNKLAFLNRASSLESFTLEGDLRTSIDGEGESLQGRSGAFDLKGIEVFKLERVLQLIRSQRSTNYSMSKLPTTFMLQGISKGRALTACGQEFPLDSVGFEPKPRKDLKYINLDAHSRFVSESILRQSYLRKPDTLNPDAPPFVSLPEGFELGIVNTQYDVSIAKAVSSILSRSIETAKDSLGGYLPEKIVEAAQLSYVSPHAISNLWGRDGYRFVLTKKVNSEIRELVATALISSSKDTLFFFTSKYNCIRHSTMTTDVNFGLAYDGDGSHKWFDQFDMPINRYKIPEYNQLANFAVERSYRGLGLGKLLITEIIKNFVLAHPDSKITHAQPLICGKGLYQIADPSWKLFMMNIGFKLRFGADTFFTNPDWAPLEPVMWEGRMVDPKQFNRHFNMPQVYEEWDGTLENESFHIPERIPHVVQLANSGRAKLQYNQLFLPFDKFPIE